MLPPLVSPMLDGPASSNRWPLFEELVARATRLSDPRASGGVLGCGFSGRKREDQTFGD